MGATGYTRISFKHYLGKVGKLLAVNEVFLWNCKLICFKMTTKSRAYHVYKYEYNVLKNTSKKK